MWLAENEGAKFWLNVLTELKNRGLNDILIYTTNAIESLNSVNRHVFPADDSVKKVVWLVI